MQTHKSSRGSILMDIFFTLEHLVLLLTAVVFTGYGYWISRPTHTQDIVEAAIDSLIEDGYLKTEGTGANMKILTWREWCNNND
jgi:hypothetical protein